MEASKGPGTNTTEETGSFGRRRLFGRKLRLDMDLVDKVEEKYMDRKIPEFRSGDTVRVNVKIQEGDKSRIQVFEGVVIAIKRNGLSSTFTVRKVSVGYGVERIFPFYSPTIQTIELVKSGRVRRAKLYYLRERKGKAARIKERRR
jgi:large subunit ribosomal protein L19